LEGCERPMRNRDQSPTQEALPLAKFHHCDFPSSRRHHPSWAELTTFTMSAQVWRRPASGTVRDTLRSSRCGRSNLD
jgi:hypothetical protein